MNKNTIIEAIDARVKAPKKPDYKAWTVGITNDTERRKSEHATDHSVKHWKDWEADSEKDAREIEQAFIKKG